MRIHKKRRLWIKTESKKGNKSNKSSDAINGGGEELMSNMYNLNRSNKHMKAKPLMKLKITPASNNVNDLVSNMKATSSMKTKSTPAANDIDAGVSNMKAKSLMKLKITPADNVVNDGVSSGDYSDRGGCEEWMSNRYNLNRSNSHMKAKS